VDKVYGKSIGRVEGEWRKIGKPGYCGYALAIRRTIVRGPEARFYLPWGRKFFVGEANF
jgi:hypothetical protein